MDTRRLEAFVKAVDLGSVTQAARLLHIAQPALSQQILALESEFKRPLLTRTPRGVLPTKAGRILYRYAHAITRQLEEARRTILEDEGDLTGNVAVGLAPFSSAMLLAGPLLTRVRAEYPGIVLSIVDGFGVTLSELMLKGRLDMAVLYGTKAPEGLDYKGLGEERFVLLGPALAEFDDGRGLATPREMGVVDLLLPPRESFLRQAVDRICAEAGFTSRVVAEVQSLTTLACALEAGLGLTVLPGVVADMLPGLQALPRRRIVSPSASLQVSLGIPTMSPMTDAAFAVYTILLEVSKGIGSSHDHAATGADVEAPA